MQTRIKTTDFEMPAATAAYLNDKIASLERLIHDAAARCEIEIGRAAGRPHHGHIWKAEIVINQLGERFYAAAHEESVHAAIDIAKDDMLRQLRKGKGKHASLARRMAARLKKFARRGDIRSY